MPWQRRMDESRDAGRGDRSSQVLRRCQRRPCRSSFHATCQHARRVRRCKHGRGSLAASASSGSRTPASGIVPVRDSRWAEPWEQERHSRMTPNLPTTCRSCRCCRCWWSVRLQPRLPRSRWQCSVTSSSDRRSSALRRARDLHKKKAATARGCLLQRGVVALVASGSSKAASLNVGLDLQLRSFSRSPVALRPSVAY